MIETTQEFIDYARANTVTTSARIVINDKNTKGIVSESGKYAIFEGEGIELNESVCVISETFEIEGWYSDEISDEEGNFSEYVTYSTTVNSSKNKDSYNLNIIFSNLRAEYAVKFDVLINSELDSSQTYNFENNTNSKITIENVPNNSNIQIKIYKWSKGYSHAKILNTYIGTIYQYEDNEIISISAKKGTDLTNESIETKTVEIKLLDAENKYNIFNEDTELACLTEDDIVSVYIGLLIEQFIYYVKVDQFYFKNIEKKENTLEVIVNAEGALSKLKDKKWSTSRKDIFMYEFKLEWYLNKYFDMESETEIDEELKEEKAYPFFKKDESNFDVFCDLGTMSRANIFENTDNKIVFKRIKESTPVAKIELRNMEEYPVIEKKEDLANIIVKVYTHSKDNEEKEIYYGKFDKNNVTFSNNITMYWILNLYSDIDLVYAESITGGISAFNLNIYNSDGTVYKEGIATNSSDYMYINMLNIWFDLSYKNKLEELSDKTFELTVKGNVINFTSIDLKKDNGTSTEKTIDIRSIEDVGTAKLITEWITSNLNKKFYYKLKIHDVFTYEIGDTVEFETGIYDSNGNMIYKTGIVTEIEYTYNGALEYYLILRGE